MSNKLPLPFPSLLVCTYHKATNLDTVRFTANFSRSATSRNLVAASQSIHSLTHKHTHTSLRSTKPSGHPGRSFHSFHPKQQGSQNSSFNCPKNEERLEALKLQPLEKRRLINDLVLTHTILKHFLHNFFCVASSHGSHERLGRQCLVAC